MKKNRTSNIHDNNSISIWFDKKKGTKLSKKKLDVNYVWDVNETFHVYKTQETHSYGSLLVWKKHSHYHMLLLILWTQDILQFLQPRKVHQINHADFTDSNVLNTHVIMLTSVNYLLLVTSFGCKNTLKKKEKHKRI